MSEKSFRQRRSTEVRIAELEKTYNYHMDCIEKNKEKIAALVSAQEAHERQAATIKEKIETLKNKPISNATMKDLAARMKERGLTINDILNYVEGLQPNKD